MNKDSSISIFFPCYNDEKTIEKLVVDAIQTVKKLTRDYEVIIIDDGSHDSSKQILNQLKKRYPSELKVIMHAKNKGYGGALQSGFKAASKDYIFYTDGDGQYDVCELPILYSLMTKDVTFVNGMKMARQDPSYRIVLGNLYSMVVRWLFWLPVYDVDCDFRLIKRSIINKITLTSFSGSICTELVKKSERAGAVFRQVSVHHYARKFGESQFFRPERLLHTFKELSFLWYRIMIKKEQ